MLLMFISLVVGFLCGSTSVGGVLLIPALTACGLNVHTATGTALLTFFFSALLGTFLHRRNGVLDLRLALPLCLGSLPFSYLGSLANQHMEAEALSLILALLILAAGLHTVCPLRGLKFNMEATSPRTKQITLLALGAGVGFFAGLTGAGGPVLSVPAMILMGFPPLASIAVAQPFQMAAAASGSIGNLLNGNVDYATAGISTLFQAVGMIAGVHMACRLPTNRIKLAVGLTCVGTALYMLLRLLGV